MTHSRYRMRGHRLALLCMTVCMTGIAAPLAAQQPPVVRESDPEARREALIELWDAVPGSSEARSGMTFAKWLAASARASAYTANSSVPIPVPGRWSSIGPLGFYGQNGFFGSLPQLDAGRVPALAFHPTDRNILFIGTSAGGVWKSTNEGASWTPVTDNQCSLVIGAIVIDPVDPNIVYAGTGEPAEATAGCGVLRSTDGGNTWTNIATAPFVTSIASAFVFYKIMIDRATAGSTTATTLVAATNQGLFRSTDSGRSWTRPTPALTFNDVVQNPGDPTMMFAARQGVTGSATPPGLWRSTDRGATWASVTDFEPALLIGRMEIAMSAALPGNVWILAGRTDRRFGGLYRWDDAAGTRTSLAATGVLASPLVSNRNNFGEQSEYNLMIDVDPKDASVIFVGGVRAFRSANGGTTFTEIAPQIHCDWHVIAVDPNDSRRVFAGSDGGAFLSRDGAQSFASVNAGLATSLHYPGLSVHPTDPTGVLTGMQDNGTILARNGTQQWNGVGGGDGAFTAINPVTPEIYYLSSQNGSMSRMDARTASSRGINSGIDPAERRAFIAPFIIDPQRPTRLYFGGTRLYRTVNEGTLWTAISPDLTRGSGTVGSLAVSPSDSNVLFVGTSDGNVRYSRDFGVTWLAPTTTLPTRTVTDFAIDPADALRTVVTLGSSGTPHVFLTKDGGPTWTDISGSLPDVSTQAVAFGPGGRIFVGNMLGVYNSADEGVTWTRDNGLPFIRITDLVYNAGTNRMTAATYGRGIWAFDFTGSAPVLRGDVNADGVVNAADALIIQQALVGVQLQSSVRLFPAGDANCDGKLEILDALLVLQFAVGSAPASACVGKRQ